MRRVHRVLLGLVAMALLAAAAFGAAPAKQRMTFGGFTIVANAAEGSLSGAGPWTFSKGVTVSSQGLQLACDTLKAWLAKGGHNVQRLEATGNVRVHGTVTASDGTTWRVAGSSQAASYEAGNGQGVLRGTVDFQATNLTTKAVVHVKAAKAIYNTKTQKFSFERGPNEPIQTEWQQPEQPAPAAGSSAGGK